MENKGLAFLENYDFSSLAKQMYPQNTYHPEYNRTTSAIESFKEKELITKIDEINYSIHLNQHQLDEINFKIILSEKNVDNRKALKYLSFSAFFGIIMPFIILILYKEEIISNFNTIVSIILLIFLAISFIYIYFIKIINNK